MECFVHVYLINYVLGQMAFKWYVILHCCMLRELQTKVLGKIFSYSL